MGRPWWRRRFAGSGRAQHLMRLARGVQEVVADAVDVASDKVVDYGSVALSKADEATNVAARATANKVAEARCTQGFHEAAGVFGRHLCGVRVFSMAGGPNVRLLAGIRRLRGF